jgi:lysophospholipase L1-like esterase
MNEISPAANKKTRQSNRLRALGLRLATLGLSIALALLACELGLRAAGYSPTYINAMGSFHQADDVCGHRGLPNLEARFASTEFDVRVVHDEVGFRRLENPEPAERDARRVHIFGDSFAWGWGVDQGESFPDQLQLRLPDHKVEGLGVNGVGTVAEHELFASECRDRLQPGDVVLLTFCQNDFSDNVNGSRHAEVRDGQVVLMPANSHLRPNWKRTCQQSSHLFNYLSFVINRFQLERRLRRDNQVTSVSALASAAKAQAAPPQSDVKASANVQQVVHVDEVATTATPIAASPVAPAPPVAGPQVAAPSAPTPSGGMGDQVIVTRYFLEKWQRECKDRGARFIVAFIPGMGELTESPFASVESLKSNEAAFRDAFFSCAHSLDIETLDLLPGMLAAKQDSQLGLLAFPRDTHWTATGHRVVADIIAERLTEPRAAAP